MSLVRSAISVAYIMYFGSLVGISTYRHGRTGRPSNLALARWAGWLAGQMGRHVVCWSRSNKKNYWSLYLPPKFKTKVLSELLNPQTSHRPSSFVMLLIYILVTYPVNRQGEERRDFKEARNKVTKRRRGKYEVGGRVLSWSALLGYLCRGPSS